MRRGNDSFLNIKYELELIMLQPTIGDIIFGKIIESNINFITVDCDMIKVKVPTEKLMKPAQL
jgi:hypothetical protein